MAHSSILVFSLNSLNDAPQFVKAVRTATEQSRSAIEIVVFSHLFDDDGGLSHTANWDAVNNLLSLFYVEAMRVAQSLGNVLLRIDVLLKGLQSAVELPSELHVERIFRIEGGTRFYLSRYIFVLNMTHRRDGIPSPRLDKISSCYEAVC
jgi:hypothetical protein